MKRIPDEVRNKAVARALEQPELSPRVVAITLTDAERSFVSETSVSRVLRAEGLATSPPLIVMKVANSSANPTTATKQLWHVPCQVIQDT